MELDKVDDDLTNIEIVKYVSPIVQVSAVDETGRPVKDVKLAGLYANDDKTFTPTATGMPSHMFFEHQSDGRYRTSQMMPDVKTTFTARADHYEDASETVTLPEGGQRQIKLTLKKKAKDSKAEAPTGNTRCIWARTAATVGQIIW